MWIKKKLAHVDTWNGTVVEYHPQRGFVLVQYVSEPKMNTTEHPSLQ
jgi:hypothetical protein